MLKSTHKNTKRNNTGKGISNCDQLYPEMNHNSASNKWGGPFITPDEKVLDLLCMPQLYKIMNTIKSRDNLLSEDKHHKNPSGNVTVVP